MSLSFERNIAGKQANHGERLPNRFKTVYLIRHAESLQNVSINAIRDSSICCCVPLIGFLCNAWGLHDAPLSEAGMQQVANVRRQINGPEFLEKAKIREFVSV